MALARGIHALVQPPIARNGAEADALLDTAAESDARLLVDYGYRTTPAAQAARAAVEAGRLGTLRSVQARFHNIWGPPGGWLFDRDRAGGGVLMDLGVPMIDLALYLLGFPAAGITAAHLWRGGGPPGAEVEDFATLIGTIAGAPFHCEVGWQVPLPQATISLTFYGTTGTLTWHNVNGSFCDFAAHLGHHQWDELLASGTADLRGDTSAPLSPPVTLLTRPTSRRTGRSPRCWTRPMRWADKSRSNYRIWGRDPLAFYTTML